MRRSLQTLLLTLALVFGVRAAVDPTPRGVIPTDHPSVPAPGPQPPAAVTYRIIPLADLPSSTPRGPRILILAALPSAPAPPHYLLYIDKTAYSRIFPYLQLPTGLHPTKIIKRGDRTYIVVYKDEGQIEVRRYDVYEAKKSQELEGSGEYIGRLAKDRVKDSWGGVKTIATGDGLMAVDQMQEDMSHRYAKVMVDHGEGTALVVMANDMTGGTQVVEAAWGVDLVEGVDLSREERWSRGLQGGGQVVLSTIGGAKGVHSARNSLSRGVDLSLNTAKQQVTTAARQVRNIRIDTSVKGNVRYLKEVAKYKGTGVKWRKAPKRAFSATDSQLGKKLGQHAPDFGLDPSNPAHRAQIRAKIEAIGTNPEKVVQGTFAGQGTGGARGAVEFRIVGNDVVVTTTNGEFVTILKDGVTGNTSVKAALEAASQGGGL